MGYSISEKQYKKLEALRAEGRQCSMSTNRGGCFNRATVKNHIEGFAYKLDEGTPSRYTHTLCTTHAQEAGYEGVNFRVLSTESF